VSQFLSNIDSGDTKEVPSFFVFTVLKHLFANLLPTLAQTVELSQAK
jgi:hypothetical protein